MNISWVLADDIVLDPTVNIDQLKKIGSLWGSWRTWRACQTDNVICHQASRAQELIEKNFQSICNFYIHNGLYILLDTPPGVQPYGGDFSHGVSRPDELVAMHLASASNNIVLLLGFDWTENTKNQDPHQWGMIYSAIKSNEQTQWVLVDPPENLRPDLASLGNFTTDSLPNVLKFSA